MNKIISILLILLFVGSIFPITNSYTHDDDISLLMDEENIQNKQSIDDPGAEKDNTIIEFSPLEHTRMSEYESHMITEQEVLDLKSQIGVRDPEKNYNQLYNGLGTGLAPPTEDEWEVMEGNIEVVTSALSPNLPSSLDLSGSSYFPPVRSQASQGSCAAWATTYYTATYLQAKDQGWTLTSSGNNNQILSPAWTYNKANGGVDAGSHSWTNYYVLSDIGGATWNSMPYNQNDDTGWGSVTAWREAPKYRFGGFKWTDPQNIDVIRSWVSDGYTVPFALHASNFTSGLGSGDNTISSAELNTKAYNHANTIVGYDDDKVTDGDVGAFKIVNSWGSSWGSAWGGFGYYWMTYKAFQKLVYPVIMFHDKIDYTPTMLATWNFTGSVSRSEDFTIGIGNTSDPYDTKEPYLNGGSTDYPSFMCLDVTDFQSNAGLDKFYIEFDTGSGGGSLSSFKLELYENGYVINNPSKVSAESSDVPQTLPCTANNTISGYQVKIDSPSKEDWYKGTIQATGSADDFVTETLIHEDFEAEFPEEWEVGDSDSRKGYDYWNTSTARAYAGFRSGWCAAEKEPIFEENFDSDEIPIGWTTFDVGPDNGSWNFTNTDYEFVYDGDDYAAFCDSNVSGTGLNITTWLYMNTSFNAAEYSYLYLEFFLDYKYNDGNEYAQVLYSNGTSYPSFYNLQNWTNSTYGWQRLNLSTAAGEDEVYLAFRYHGTDDHYMFINELTVTGHVANDEYENYMDSYIYQSVNLTRYDRVNYSYDYWLDSESNWDYLYVVYFSYSYGAWYYVDGHSGISSGWQSSYALIPTDATDVGSFFEADSSNSNYEGAYIDNLTLTGYTNLSTVEIKIGTGPWTTTNGTSIWNYSVDTTKYSDGKYNVSVRAKYGINYSYDHAILNIDNTPPNTFTPVASPSSWANDSQPEITFSTTDATSGIDYYSVKIDSGSFSNQTSPYTLPPLTDGAYTITVRAYDKAGNYRDDVVNVYVDTTTPNAFVTTASPNVWTNNTQPVVTFSTTDDTSGMDHFEVKIDSGSFSTQTSPYTITTLADGSHLVTVRALDVASNYKDSKVNVYVDTTGPVDFTPTANPGGWSPITQPVISFSTTDATSGVDYYSISIDNSSYSNQTSPYTLPVQSDGIHNVTVRAFDLAGNFIDREVKVYIDTTLPNSFTPTANPNSWTANTRPLITFSTIDSTSGISHYAVSIDSGSFTNQTSPYTLPIQSDGVHTITVRAFNNAGKYIDGTVKVYVDTEKPVSFTPLANPAGWTNTVPEITFTTTDATSGVIYYKVSIDTSNFFTQTSPYILPQLSDGMHNITVRAFDKAGNLRDGYVNVYTDTTNPNEFEPTAKPSAHISWYSNATPELTFFTTDDASGISHYAVSVDPGLFINQTSPFTLPSLDDGINKVIVRAYDQAGNYIDATVDLHIDTTSPNPFTPIAAPPSWTSNNKPTVSFNTSDNTSGILYYRIKINTGVFSVQTSPYELPVLVDGVHTVTVRAYDNAGNYIDCSCEVYIDTENPKTFTPNTLPSGWANFNYNNSKPVIEFQTTDETSGIARYEVSVNSGNFSTQTSPFYVPFIGDGKNVVTVRAFDLAGNYRDGVVEVFIDSTKPNELFIPESSYKGWTSSSQPQISFSTTDNTSGINHYEVSIDSGSFVNQTSPYTLPTLKDGKHTVTVRAYDNAGNFIDASIEIKIDTEEPTELSIKVTKTEVIENATIITLDLSAIDNLSGVFRMCFSTDGVTWDEWEDFESTKVYSITSSDVDTIYFKVRDQAGNIAIPISTKLSFTPEVDVDTDNDGYPDFNDAFPHDKSEWLDTNEDGIGDNADPDDDGDGYLDTWEQYFGTDTKDDSSSPIDTDGDLIPDGDKDNTEPWMDPDDDQDGYSDEKELRSGSDPLDKDSNPSEKAESGFNYMLLLIILIIIIIVILLAFLFLRKKKQVERPISEQEPIQSRPEPEFGHERDQEPLESDYTGFTNYFDNGASSRTDSSQWPAGMDEGGAIIDDPYRAWNDPETKPVPPPVYETWPEEQNKEESKPEPVELLWDEDADPEDETEAESVDITWDEDEGFETEE